MRTEARASWPIAVRRAGARALIGIPERLGDGSLPQPSTFGAFPTLEEIAGEDWRAGSGRGRGAEKLTGIRCLERERTCPE